jgi:cytochrome b pre-mRNA-processing protein 3
MGAAPKESAAGASEALVNLRGMFRPKPSRAAGEALYEAVTRQARQPEFYSALGVPDSVEGRFELYTLHAVLLLRRLKGQGPQAADTAQALFDAYVGALDNTLREMGVGDLTVPKKMRGLGAALYGRATAYDAALTGEDRPELLALLQRTVFGDAPAPARGKLADYVEASAARLADQPLEAILEGAPAWPAIPA